MRSSSARKPRSLLRERGGLVGAGWSLRSSGRIFAEEPRFVSQFDESMQHERMLPAVPDGLFSRQISSSGRTTTVLAMELDRLRAARGDEAVEHGLDLV